jgi:hypothetical protein
MCIAGCFSFLVTSQPISVSFRYFNRLLALFTDEPVRDVLAAGTGKKPPLSTTGLAPQEIQHLLWVGASQPLFLRHALVLRSPRMQCKGHPALDDGLGTVMQDHACSDLGRGLVIGAVHGHGADGVLRLLPT